MSEARSISSRYAIAWLSSREKISREEISEAGSQTIIFRFLSFIYLFIYLFVYLFVCLFVCLFIYLFVCLFIYFFVFYLQGMPEGTLGDSQEKL